MLHTQMWINCESIERKCKTESQAFIQGTNVVTKHQVWIFFFFFFFFFGKTLKLLTCLISAWNEVVSYNSFSKFFCLLKTKFEQSNIKNIVIKRDINKASIEHFKSLFNSTDWDLVTQTSLPNHSYNIFLEIFVQIYDETFPERKLEIKAKNLVSPWITRSLRKSSRNKQHLYEKFLKQRNSKN